MSIRVGVCVLFVLFFSVYAWKKSWFVSLCALVVFMAVNQHPDMPKSIGGIQGLNMWNILMLNVLGAWWFKRRQEGLVWDLPRYVQNLLLIYFCVVLVSSFRFFLSPDAWGELSAASIFSEFFINSVKWVLPGMLLFDACRTKTHVVIALASVLALYTLLALQVIKHVPLRYAATSEFSGTAYKQIEKSVGYNRVTLSMMLGGASWAMLATLILARKHRHKLAILAAAGLITLGQALTGGRSGYVCWGIVGLILCLVRWRRLLPVIPVAVLAVIIFLPGVRDRMLQGFGGKQGNIVVANDDYRMTSGRTIAWPYVIEKIFQSPLIGYGREAMTTTGIFQNIQDDYPDERFAHPHNAYLQVLLDSGIIGFLGVIPFYLVVLWHSFRLLLDQENALASAIGGVGCAMVLALLVAAMGGQTFYPREGSVGMWAAIGLLLRLSVESSRSRFLGTALFAEETESENAAEP